MKKRIVTLLLLANLLLAFGTLGRMVLMKELPSPEPETGRFVFLAPNREEDFWVEVAQGVKAADEALGTETVLVQYQEEDELASYVEDAVRAGAQGIIMKGDLKAGDAGAYAVEAGIPVFFYDSDFPDYSRTSYVGSDNEKAGRMAGELLTELMGPSGRYLLLTRSVAAFSQRGRVEGLEAVLAGYPEISCAGVIEDRGDPLTLRNELEAAFHEGQVSGIVSIGGTAADSLGGLLESWAIPGEELAVIVTDLTEQSAAFLESGTYDAVITLDPWQIGYTAVKLLEGYVREGTALEDQNLLEMHPVTGENLSEFLREKKDYGLEWNSY